MEPRLEVDALAVAAGGERLLAGVALCLRAGEIAGLSGPSGVGKTRLLRALARLDEPAEGTVRLDGSTAEDLGFPAYRRRVVYVAQRPAVVGPTVGDDLRLPFSFACAAAGFDEETARGALDRLGLRPDLDASPARWSEGQRQRLALARALLVDPPVLLLDEPTSALDEASRDRVEGWLEELAAAGTTIVVVSHDPAQLRRLADQTLALERFRV